MAMLINYNNVYSSIKEVRSYLDEPLKIDLDLVIVILTQVKAYWNHLIILIKNIIIE